MQTLGIYGANGRRQVRIEWPVVKGSTDVEGMFSFRRSHFRKGATFFEGGHSLKVTPFEGR